MFKLTLAVLFILEQTFAHKFYLMPYPVFKDRSDDAKNFEFNDFVTHNGRLKRQYETPIITIDNQHEFVDDGRDIQSFVVGTKYRIADDSQQESYNRQPRNLEDKEVFMNGRFSRGIKNFKPSPRINSGIDFMMGQWVPGNLPGEYNWRGSNYDPMQRYRSNLEIGEDVYY